MPRRVLNYHHLHSPLRAVALPRIHAYPTIDHPWAPTLTGRNLLIRCIGKDYPSTRVCCARYELCRDSNLCLEAGWSCRWTWLANRRSDRIISSYKYGISPKTGLCWRLDGALSLKWAPWMTPMDIVAEGWVLGVYNNAAECLLIPICKGWDGDQTDAMR